MKNGWYVYAPHDDYEEGYSFQGIDSLVGCGKQVVQVIEGDVWVTGCGDIFSVKEAKFFGKFKKKVKL
jgi:hypothetical protein